MSQNKPFTLHLTCFLYLVLQQVTKKVSKGLHTSSVLRNVSTARWSLPTGLLYKIHLTACCHSKLTHNPSLCPLHHPILLVVPLTPGGKLNYFHQKGENITCDSKWSCTLKGRLNFWHLPKSSKLGLICSFLLKNSLNYNRETEQSLPFGQ